MIFSQWETAILDLLIFAWHIIIHFERILLLDHYNLLSDILYIKIGHKLAIFMNCMIFHWLEAAILDFSYFPIEFSLGLFLGEYRD